VRNLLNSAVSGAAIVAQGLFAALFPSDCRLCGTPLENISRLPVWVATVARTLKNGAASFEIEAEFETAAQAS